MADRKHFTDLIHIGQRVHCILYGGKDGVVYAIHGEQSPGTCATFKGGVGCYGGNAYFDIVWDNGTHSPRTPESLIRTSVQWEVFPEIADAAEINAMHGAVVLETQRKADEQAEKNRKFSEECAALRSNPEFSFLKQTTPGKYESVAFGAANLRAELKHRFPGTKFSVRSKTFSMGDSIDVSWVDGPTDDEVDKIAKKYSAGWFDGMEDLYHYSSSPWNSVFGDAKYVHVRRSYSKAVLEKAVETVCKSHGWEPLEVHSYSDGSCYLPCDNRDRYREVFDFLEKRGRYEISAEELERERLKARLAELEAAVNKTA